MLYPYKVAAAEANLIISEFQKFGIRAEVAGGVYKKKLEVHDIDIAIDGSSVSESLGLEGLKAMVPRVAVPVELYVSEKEYGRMRDWLRAGTWQAINGRMAQGLRYRKVKV